MIKKAPFFSASLIKVAPLNLSPLIATKI